MIKDDKISNGNEYDEVENDTVIEENIEDENQHKDKNHWNIVFCAKRPSKRCLYMASINSLSEKHVLVKCIIERGTSQLNSLSHLIGQYLYFGSSGLRELSRN